MTLDILATMMVSLNRLTMRTPGMFFAMSVMVSIFGIL